MTTPTPHSPVIVEINGPPKLVPPHMSKSRMPRSEYRLWFTLPLETPPNLPVSEGKPEPKTLKLPKRVPFCFWAKKLMSAGPAPPGGQTNSPVDPRPDAVLFE